MNSSALCALLGLLLCACLPPLKPANEASAEQVDAHSEATSEPPSPPAQMFDTHAEPRPVRADYAARLELERVASSIAVARAPALVGDGRLGDMGLVLARRLTHESVIDTRSLRPLARERGLVNALPQILFASAASLEELRKYLIEQGTALATQYQSTHFGLGATRRGSVWSAVLVLDRRPLELAPVPRALPVAGDVRIEAKLLEGLSEAALIVTRPDGVSETVVHDRSKSELAHTLTLSEGTWGIEIMGTGEHGPAVVANISVQVGQLAQAAGPRLPASDTDSGLTPSTVPEFIRQLEALIHAERAKQGVHVVTRDALLDAVALGHSTDMRDNQFFGHVSKTTGGPGERIAAAQANVWGVRENVARGYGPGDVHESLMSSPAHRAALLTKDSDRLGLGVAMMYEGNRPVFYVTELFARLPHPFEPGLALEAGAKRVSELRAARGLFPVIPDTRLSRSAETAATRFFKEPGLTHEQVLQAAFAGAQVPRGATSLVARLMTGLEPGELEETPEMLDPSVRWLGVGVAQGSHPSTGPGGLAVVLLLAK